MGGVVSRLLGERYRLVEQLGAGGMSVVWRGYDEVLGRQVAVKVLTPKLAAERTFRHRIRIEAQAAARLCHPHITNVYDYGESSMDGATVPYVIMELVDGESLGTHLRGRGALPWREAVAVCAEVASALAAAHARGVVHRDVTPGNVMVTAAGAKVVDFGISALVGESDAGPDGSLLGTPAYLAPERLEGGQVTAATDVYAVGLMLYRSLIGRLPWQASTTTQMLRAHLYADPGAMPPVPGLPAEVVELCQRCLAKAPKDRPTSAEVARTLAAALGVPSIVPISPAPVTGDTVAVEDVATAGTTILPWSTATDAISLSGWRSGPRPRRLQRAAMVGAGLMAATGVAWAVTAGHPATATGNEQPTQLGMAIQQPAPCQVRYALRTDSGNAFDADVMVTNTGPAAVRDWKLAFTLPGDQTLSGGGSAAWEQRGQDVVVRPAAGAGTLEPGASVSLVLSGTYPTTNMLPVEFALDGKTCQVRVSGVAGAGGAAPSPTATAAASPTPGGNANSGSGRSGSDGSGSSKEWNKGSKGHGRGKG